MRSSLIPSLVSVLALVLASLSCAPGSAAGSVPSGPPPPPAVTVEPVEVRAWTEHVELTGRLGPIESVEVRPRISGHVEAVLFTAGQLVQKDQVLFRIDPRSYRAEVERRAADLAAAEARLAISESEEQRAAKLVADKAISAEEAEARAARVHEWNALRAAAKAGLASAQLDLEFTEIRAPVAGRISRALVTEGNYVGGAAGSSAVLATIVSVDPIYFYADLDEGSFLRFERLARERSAEGVPITIELGLTDETGYPRTGRLEALDNHLDVSTGTILLRAVFPNTDGRLVPGLFARARLPIGAPREELTVDDRAVGTDQNQKYVLAVGAGDVAEYRKVKLGPVQDGRRVIREGLTQTDRVIVSGLQKARPGAPVKPETADASTASAGR